MCSSLMILLTCPVAEMQAEIIMPVTFGDGMVLQRDAPLRIFGQASEGAEVVDRIQWPDGKGDY